MLQNSRAAAFTVSELLRGNQQYGVKLHPTQIKVKTVFLEMKAKTLRLLEPNIFHSDYFRKLFSSYCEVKRECSKSLKVAFFFFRTFFSAEGETLFWESGIKTLNKLTLKAFPF